MQKDAALRTLAAVKGAAIAVWILVFLGSAAAVSADYLAGSLDRMDLLFVGVMILAVYEAIDFWRL